MNVSLMLCIPIDTCYKRKLLGIIDAGGQSNLGARVLRDAFECSSIGLDCNHFLRFH